MDTIQELESQRNALLQQITEVGDFRPGNLSSFHRKCYKPYCRCAKPDDPGHPGWQLTRKGKNQKTIRRNIPKHALEATREHLEEHNRFRNLVKRVAEVSDQLCQARIKHGLVEKKTLHQSRRKTRSQSTSHSIRSQR